LIKLLNVGKIRKFTTLLRRGTPNYVIAVKSFYLAQKSENCRPYNFKRVFSTKTNSAWTQLITTSNCRFSK